MQEILEILILDLAIKSDADFYMYLTDFQMNIIPMNPQINLNRNDFEDSISMQEFIRYDFSNVKVTIHIPYNVNPRQRQQKINQIYDILNHKTA